MTDSKMDTLKKLKADNILETETLDQASGGNANQVEMDSKFLHKLLEGHEKQPPVVDYPLVNMDASEANPVLEAWESVGVKVIYHKRSSNQYFIGGKQVSRSTAYIHAQKTIGRFLDSKDIK